MSKQRAIVKNSITDMEYTTHSDNAKEGRRKRRKKKQQTENK